LAAVPLADLFAATRAREGHDRGRSIINHVTARAGHRVDLVDHRRSDARRRAAWAIKRSGPTDASCSASSVRRDVAGEWHEALNFARSTRCR